MGAPGGFTRGSPVFIRLLIGPSHMSRNNLERDIKLNKKIKLFPNRRPFSYLNLKYENVHKYETYLKFKQTKIDSKIVSFKRTRLSVIFRISGISD